MAGNESQRYFARMKNVALALLAAAFLFACSEPAADDTGSSEAAYSFTDPPRAVVLDPAAVHVECTSTHGSFIVLTFEDRIFTAHGDDTLDACVALRQELTGRTSPLRGTLVEEHGAINRGTLDLEIGRSLASWGN